MTPAPQGEAAPQEYPEYRNTGHRWLSRVPSHWDEKPLKHVVAINTEKLGDSTDADIELEYVDIGNVTLTEGITSTERLRFEVAPSRARRIAREGDTIVSTVRTYLKAVAYISDPPPNLIVSTGFAVLRPSNALCPRYLYRLAQSEAFVQAIVAHSVGVSYPAINPTDVGALYIPLPPLPEQREIAAWLDDRTRRIDELVAAKRRLIELLAEQRTAVITRAVTKGLNPDAPMKPTGIDWLGKVPKHWKVKPLKYAVTFQRGHDLPTEERIEGDVPVVTSAGPSAWHNRPMAIGPGIVTGRYGTIGIFHLVQGPYWPLNTTLYSISLHSNNPFYLKHMLHTLKPVFLLNAAKSAVPGVDRNDLHPIPVAVPPRSEQDQIAEHLELSEARNYALTTAAEAVIERLNEYRQALISEAMTGKIDLRGEKGSSV